MEGTNTEVNVTILISDREYHVQVEEMTGLQLKELAGIPSTNILYREIRGPGEDEKIDNDTVVHLHSGDKFYDMPPGNFGELR